MTVVIGTGNGIHVELQDDDTTENGSKIVGLRVRHGLDGMKISQESIFIPLRDPMGLTQVLAWELQKESPDSILDDLFG